VAVIGGGVIGTVAALRLQQRGLAVTLIDPDPVWRGASCGNAGHIAADEVHPLASRATLRSLPKSLFLRGGPVGLPLRDLPTWLPFGLRLLGATRRYEAGHRALASLQAEALPAWQRLIADLGASDLLRNKGHFMVWETAESATAGKAELARTGTGNTTWRDADAQEWALLARLCSARGGAVRFSRTGQITDLTRVAETLVARFEAAGGVRMRGRARFHRQGIAIDTGEVIHADLVLVAAGPASGALLRPLGLRAPLIAERGYHIETDANVGVGGNWPDDMPSIHFADRAMFVTRFLTRLRATSFVEFGRASSPPDPRKWRRLRRHAEELGLPFAEPVAEWMGARPTLPDYLPAIGRSRAHPNLLYAFGHHHLGLTLAAATGEAVAALATGETPPVDLAPFDLQRFE
jgi:D-amino-acid dehydrogenase